MELRLDPPGTKIDREIPGVDGWVVTLVLPSKANGDKLIDITAEMEGDQALIWKRSPELGHFIDAIRADGEDLKIEKRSDGKFTDETAALLTKLAPKLWGLAQSMVFLRSEEEKN